MHDAAAMEGGERIEHRQRDGQGFEWRHGPTGDARGQRFPVEQFHDEIGLALSLVELVEGADVRVADASGGPGLPAKPFPRHVVGQRLGTNHLDGDIPVQPVVVPGIHDAHAALAKRSDDSITSYVIHRGAVERLGCR